MLSKRPGTPAKVVFPIVLLAFLLALAIASQPARAQTFKVLHTFHGQDGAFPVGQLVRDKTGNLYGTTADGGFLGLSCYGESGGCGTAFKMSKTGKLVWLHSFNGANGQSPVAGLLRDAAGNLYGTTDAGGTVKCGVSFGCGTVFKLNKNGTETLLYSFTGQADGSTPQALLVGDSAGNVYGTTIWGGYQSNGVVFKADQAGKETVLYTFQGGTDGGMARPGVIWGSPGYLYGIAGYGANGEGVLFQVDATTGKETVLYNFTGGSEGVGESLLVEDTTGNLYGTTESGGNTGRFLGMGCGVVYKLSPQSGGGWMETVLYTFCSLSNCADGAYPGPGPLVLDTAGNLYGITEQGGTSCACGVVFKLDPTGKETLLHSFTGGTDGALPVGGLTMGTAGALYGAAEYGGDLNCAIGRKYGGCGVVFKITP